MSEINDIEEKDGWYITPSPEKEHPHHVAEREAIYAAEIEAASKLRDDINACIKSYKLEQIAEHRLCCSGNVHEQNGICQLCYTTVFDARYDWTGRHRTYSEINSLLPSSNTHTELCNFYQWNEPTHIWCLTCKIMALNADKQVADNLTQKLDDLNDQLRKLKDNDCILTRVRQHYYPIEDRASVLARVEMAKGKHLIHSPMCGSLMSSWYTITKDGGTRGYCIKCEATLWNEPNLSIGTNTLNETLHNHAIECKNTNVVKFFRNTYPQKYCIQCTNCNINVVTQETDVSVTERRIYELEREIDQLDKTRNSHNIITNKRSPHLAKLFAMSAAAATK